ncbi:AAA family ATPase [Escherichia coli]|nr:AAA family ATPase [Escherichia coli]
MKQDIEASVIGGLLIGGLTPTASDVLATLEPEAFSIPLYRKAFEVIRKQARNRNLIDALMVAEECGEEHFTSILMTSKNCPSAANLKGYAGMVADNYHRRLVLEIMDEMREPIQSGTIDASSQSMDELVKRLSAIRKPRDEVKPVRLGEIITDYTDTLDRRLRNGEESDTLKTGIEELDAITGGMNAEDLVIIAARPGMGKTELALKIAEGVASRVIPGSDVRRGVLIFSMEMSALQIAERSIANAGRMSVSVLRNPASMDDEGWARVANGMSQLADLDVWVSAQEGAESVFGRDLATDALITNGVKSLQSSSAKGLNGPAGFHSMIRALPVSERVPAISSMLQDAISHGVRGGKSDAAGINHIAEILTPQNVKAISRYSSELGRIADAYGTLARAAVKPQQYIERTGRTANVLRDLDAGLSNVTSTVLNAIANSTSGAIVGGAGGGIAGAAAGALVGAGLKGAVSKIATTRSGRYAIEKAVQEATKAVRAGGSKEALAAAERRFIANKAAVKAIRDAVGNEEFQRLARAGIVASLSGMAQE